MASKQRERPFEVTVDGVLLGEIHGTTALMALRSALLLTDRGDGDVAQVRHLGDDQRKSRTIYGFSVSRQKNLGYELEVIGIIA